MLFILALEPLQRLLQLAENGSTLTPIHNRAAKIRISLYADVAAIFINSVREEIETVKEILNAFGRSSGLHVNLTKSAAYPIRCEGTNLQKIRQSMPREIKNFPCKYLGLPLILRQLKRVEIQPLIDRIAGKLPRWKGELMDKAGRLTLVRTVLTAMPFLFPHCFLSKEMGCKADR